MRRRRRRRPSRCYSDTHSHGSSEQRAPTDITAASRSRRIHHIFFFTRKGALASLPREQHETLDFSSPYASTRGGCDITQEHNSFLGIPFSPERSAPCSLPHPTLFPSISGRSLPSLPPVAYKSNEQRARFHLETNGRPNRPRAKRRGGHHRIIRRRLQPAHGVAAAHLDYEDDSDRGRSEAEAEAGDREKTDGWKDRRRTYRRTAANAADAAAPTTTTEGILWCHIIIRAGKEKEEETKGLRLRRRERVNRLT